MQISRQQHRIASTLHHMQTLEYTKKSLSIYEDKRCWLSLNYSLPYGHYSLRQTRPTVKHVGVIPTHVELEDEGDNSAIVSQGSVNNLDVRQPFMPPDPYLAIIETSEPEESDSEEDLDIPSPKRFYFADDEAGVD